MKKQYTTPEVNVVKVNPTEIICTSASFGDGDTPIMHAKGRRGFDFDDDLWDE
ncbi:MAG: hypothetical protein KBT39_12530 [Bacteroidales bacterium]|nr:hypothetical protein [Bacteroidales bacterium]